jgi:hypothetical protein
MSDDWQQTDRIVMAVQTAEIRQTSVTSQPTLNLSCSLVNIARGQCLLEISSGEIADSADVGPNIGANIGQLVIEIDRPVIRGNATIPRQLYDALLSRLASAPPRQISLNLSIASKLAVSLEGDLRIDDETVVQVTDLAVTLPLK